MVNLAGRISLYGLLKILFGLKSFPSILNQRYDKYLINLVFWVRTISYGTSIFPFGFMPGEPSAWAKVRAEETIAITYSTDIKLG